MSQENLEIVRRWKWAFDNDRDTFIELTHPEIEWAPFEENHTIFHGIDSALQVRSGWLDTWAEHQVTTEELIDAGNGVLDTAHLVGRGKSSGLEVDVRLYIHFKLREGKVVYVYEYEDRAEALKAVGLAAEE